MWARRVACALAVCACAAAAPLDTATAPPPSATFATPGPCDTLVLKTTPPLRGYDPASIPEKEAEVARLARLYAGQVSRGAVDKSSGGADDASSSAAHVQLAAYLAREALHESLRPLASAVALAAPHLRLGVLYFAHANKIYIFQQNNTQALQQFWVTLASAWNVSSVVWSPGWAGCGEAGPSSSRESQAKLGGWWSGAAASHGDPGSRVAAALYWQHINMPCEPAMYHNMGGPPRCDDKSTECEAYTSPSTDSTPKLTYRCRCRDYHRKPDSDEPAGRWVTSDALAQGALVCSPCDLTHIKSCLSDTGRTVFLALHLSNLLFCVGAASCVFKKRKRKLIASSIWTILELVVVGAFLMCASAASSLLPSPLWRCLAGPWLRELGFIMCYGAVVLRLWVLLAEFRTRKAHRWTPRDAEVLKILGAMLLGAVCYLSAFTATALCPYTRETETRNPHTDWHHVTAASELLLLIVGLRIGYATRNANVPFQEHYWLCGVLMIEALCIVGWRAIGWSGESAPEESTWAAWIRAQFSSIVTVLLVLVPRVKASSHHEASRCSQSEGFMSAGAGGYGGGGGGGGEDEPSVEEARAELRRLYAALEAIRGRALRRDNPHVSRRRGGRKPPHRRFSLQALQARRGGKGKSGNSTVEPSDVGESRTPEDSVCSIEGPSHYTDGD